jgi:hypothetical protein
MKSIEMYLSELARHRNSQYAASTSRDNNCLLTLPEEVRQAANRGWQIFPVSPLAKFSGNPDLLIAEATSEVSRLEEFAAEYPTCRWRVALGSSSLCALELEGQAGRESFTAVAGDQGESLTLQARRGDAALAFFQLPKGSVLRASAKKLATGLRILGESCLIPPSSGYDWVNPWAEVEAVPYSLRELAFEPSDIPRECALPLPQPSNRHAFCRSTMNPTKPRRGEWKGYRVCGQSGSGQGFRVSHRR